MAIHYYCRHCGTKVGSIEENIIDASRLGFHQLSNEERSNMIQYEKDGTMKVQSICEDCQETLERNPEYHQYETFIQ